METNIVPVGEPVNRNRYNVAVNSVWPKELPPMTDNVARRAFRALYHHRFGKPWRGHKLRIVRGRRRRTYWNRLAPDSGWHAFIHDLSHDFHAKQYPKEKPHGPMHGAVERDLIEQVLARGWLNEAPKAPKAKPERNIIGERKAAVALRLAKWEAKRKRAETAIKKLRRQMTYYERKVN